MNHNFGGACVTFLSATANLDFFKDALSHLLASQIQRTIYHVNH